MFGKKGQAFDTFKLMIAAVVAVAILGILLTILGGINPPGQEPAAMIEQQLTQATQYPGSIFVSQSEASFKKGVVYTADSFAEVLGGGDPQIDFDCDSTLGGCDGGSNELTITADFRAIVKACCNRDNDCTVGIGRESDATCP